MELPDEIYTQVEVLSERGNLLIDAEDYEGALTVWREALALLPEPRQDWEAAIWLNASIGDAAYLSGDYAEAKEALFDALNVDGAVENPFLHYLLGKTLLRLEDERAINSLLQAYMLAGEDIFEDDEEEGSYAFRILQDRGLVDQD